MILVCSRIKTFTSESFLKSIHPFNSDTISEFLSSYACSSYTMMYKYSQYVFYSFWYYM
jgi:hypothetical protein